MVRRRISRDGRDLPYAVTVSEVAGGLNNMIMVVAQLLHQTCDAGRGPTMTLVLPRFSQGKNFFKRHQKDPYNNESMAFSELFHLRYFQRAIAPCTAVPDLPEGARDVRVVKILPIDRKWPEKYGHMLALTYGALRPGTAVRAPFSAALRTVDAATGSRWAAVHLRIEKDWFYVSPFCNLIKFTPRRCFTPTEAAILTRRQRERLNASGTLLLYAEELLNPRIGPHVNRSAFGDRTVKLPTHKLENVSYTVRAAVEMFVAAHAPAGFYGNAYSTFSRGVALLRAARDTGTCGAQCESYSYGLALPSPYHRLTIALPSPTHRPAMPVPAGRAVPLPRLS